MSQPPSPQRHRRRQRGVGLIEAMVAFLVLGFGMLSTVGMLNSLRGQADTARQRSEAVRFAQAEIEALRGFATLGAAAGASAPAGYAAIADALRRIDAGGAEGASTTFQLRQRVDAAGIRGARGLSVQVEWAGRDGAAQQVTLHSIVAGSDPAGGASLGLQRSVAGVAAGQPLARAASIPRGARDLGDGRSAFKPASSGSIAYVFDNRSGVPVARCSELAPTLFDRDLTVATLGGCSAIAARWLSGRVRYSGAVPPTAADANDAPLETAVSLTLVGAAGLVPECHAEPMKAVSYAAAGGGRAVDDVPIAATAASYGLAGWIETGDRHLAYHCAVPAPAGATWSGRSDVVATGWTIGSAAGERRVCRYSSDLDGSGAIDSNLEHPASYRAVERSLAEQNFLVVGATQACPAGTAAGSGATTGGVVASVATVAHQP